ncbi:1,4-alpha-glucan branching protein GlgB [Vallitalea guaymasensis]|uniref:1,4-alpha-glucan branching enzyme GlgB n=1 Tax=Vallitalea guaymasensis TaxID=1185412 RepID=A0A8J8ME35_9FIRM|nr:1,4-alpha-glucan branching protein GlgB [Vallitalea guaymasensis]QUH30965.1 1,4-alpha-glucan branching protein GlgB [Vallitalea guaymasensis]
MKDYINQDELNVLINSNHRDPHHILGIHEYKNKYYVNAFLPYTKEVYLKDKNSSKKVKMEKVHEAGFYTILINKIIDYKFYVINEEGYKWEIEDPYRFQSQISDVDLYLFGKGTHYEIYNKLGAHVLEIDGVLGVMFAVWAPNAMRVSVIGDFNHWDGRIHQMRELGNSGIYELFIPSLVSGEKYKYEIKTKQGSLLEKSDPYGNYSELRPSTASIVANVNSYEWKDSKWLESRMNKNPIDEPVSIYEVHLGSWRRGDDNEFLSYRELADQLIKYVKDMGYTHIELLPIAEHPYDASWGYQVIGYYAVTSRFGTPEEFMYLVDCCHNNNIGVILDWVPAHFPKDEHGLIRFDGTALYEHDDPKRGEHPHWGTMIFNYGRSEVSNFLIANAVYWFDKFHIDGLRVDAVASMLYLDYGKDYGEWIPNRDGGRENHEAVEFFKHLNSIVYEKYPGIMMIAEESTSWTGVSRPTNLGGLGFGMKWNMGWMNDFLRYMQKEPVHRKYHHNDLTFSMVYAYTENFILVLSHDEVVHGKGSMIGKMPGDYWQKFANLRVAYGFMYGHPGKKLQFMGNEFAQFEEWTESKSLDWHLLLYDSHRQIQDYVRDMNKLYHKEIAFWYDDFSQNGFEWINCGDYEESIITFIRKGIELKDTLVFTCNFTPIPRTMHRIGVPYKGEYREILSSDAEKYGGSGIMNKKVIRSMDLEWDGRNQAIDIKVPPLGMSILKYEGVKK